VPPENRALIVEPMAFFPYGLHWMFLTSIQLDCSSVPPVLTRSALRIMARASNIVHVTVSSGLPFEPKWDRTYGQCRAPGTTQYA
jgi:hypothetical protein